MQNYKIKLFDIPSFLLINFMFDLYTNVGNIFFKSNYTFILKTNNDNDERK